MKIKWLLLAAALVGVATWAWWNWHQQQSQEAEFRRLAERAAHGSTELQDPGAQSSADSQATGSQATGTAASPPQDKGSRIGGAMPPPSDLLVARVDEGGYWFVGKYENGGGVEIPFSPGRQPAPPPKNLKSVHTNPGFVGPEACQSCHAEYFSSFRLTNHYRTSHRVSDESIDGEFTAGKNVLRTHDPNVSFEMLKQEGKYLQRVTFFDWQFDVPMQIVFGSSKMAQTYLYWHHDALYQLNVTHLTDGDQWINSPGYIDGDAAYARPVPERCLDCHATYFDFRSPPNHYTPDSLIFGVTCERCHGPAGEHVAYHQSHPEAEVAHGVVNPSKLSRDAELQICGQCHAGSTQLSGPALRYRPGDNLADFYHPAKEVNDRVGSVHTSNQLTRLARSGCFKNTEMTCADCHNPHQSETGKLELFSRKCLNCHESQSCTLEAHESIERDKNCIDCHMPIRSTDDLRLQSVEGDVFPPLRDHWIRVDPESTAEFLKRHTVGKSTEKNAQP